jgi:uncharacterized protein YjlB
MRSLAETTAPIQHINIIRHFLADDGQFPNNVLLPLMVYRNALHLPEDDAAQVVLDIFESNGWTNGWENGVYDYHHYHSTAHEVLALIRGSARIQFGGSTGISILLEQGDIVIVPAGVAHKNISGHDDFSVVGAYPEGQHYDVKYGASEERPEADKNIRETALPETDPVYGMSGPLIKNWEANADRIEEAL